MNNNYLFKYFYAHRGFHNKIVKENSKEAFLKAIYYNYGIELDIRLTKDYQVVVIHDVLLDGFPVTELTLKEIQKLDKNILTLEETLNIIKKRVPLLIEIKGLKKYRILCQKSLNILKDYKGKYAIISFDVRVLKWFKKHNKNILRGIISTTMYNELLKIFNNNLSLSLFNKYFNFICFKNEDLPNFYIKKLRNKGYPVIAWTIRSQKEYDFISKYSDTIIFEYFKPKKI